MDYRLYVEKKDGFNLDAKNLFNQFTTELNISNLKGVRLINVYDIFNIDKIELAKAKSGVFSEIVTDNIYNNINLNNLNYFAVEYLPGQFDQRADSTMQCLRLLSEKNKNVYIKTGKLLILDGKISKGDVDKIKKFYINPIEMREKDLGKELKIEENPLPEEVKIIDNFRKFSKKEMEKFKIESNITMTLEDLLFVQKYFDKEEKRNPSETELKVIDTYWSDHCRHTTFETNIKKIDFPKTKFGKILKNTYDEYLKKRKDVYGSKKRKVSFMDMATIVGKYMRKKGKLQDLEISDEINACSIYVDVDVNNKIEKWLLMFKNETHNHPTEIEPFGGASTCLGGAIRDPLSGRSYVYQAIRVSGAANPFENIKDTLPGKLSQKKITTSAAKGYSSYGNQIGLTTAHVAEIYHDGYKAKRMEVGAVVGAVPVANVIREKPIKGDIVVLLGGKTGRDGCGGATGSSKEHNSQSLTLCGAEVQKGNAPEERKIQRFFRNKNVTKLIKKCNDFGAGGVSVAVGELAPSLLINLDKVPVKYMGLNGTELAISESQERMAIVVAKKNLNKFVKLANEENIEATAIAVITDNNRLTMTLKNKKIVDISRDFLDTNGITQNINIDLADVNMEKSPFERNNFKSKKLKDRWNEMISDLNIASQKGLQEIFDSTIGSSTVLMPYGGKYQTTPTEVSIQKLPVGNKKTNTASAITWGFDPNISNWSPYHGAVYAIISSISKLVACGVDYRKIRMSFQEYFEKLGDNPKKWGKPAAALLGSIDAQNNFNIPAIGGKDSMSGTFNNLNVPPTLIAFSVATIKASDVISPEFKQKNSYVYLIKHNYNNNFLPNYNQLKDNYRYVNDKIRNKVIISAISVKNGGIAEALSKMSFGNKIGVDISYNIDNLFNCHYGDIVVEASKKLKQKNAILLGKTIEDFKIIVNKKETIELSNLEQLWLSKLAPIFPYKTEEKLEKYNIESFENKKIFICKNKVAKPHVLIAAFPGTNCEYDSAAAFEKEGAKAEIFVFRNIKQEYISDSIEKMSRLIDNSQIFMIPGGFSAGDEPDGSGKFIATILKNAKIAKSINNLLRRDGLILGICNGFQALVKSGLLPYGKIGKIDESSPTLTFNKIGRHVSQMVNTKIISNNSPWMTDIKVGEIFTIPVSHGEGRFYATDKIIKELMKNGQIATQYVDFAGNATSEFIVNPNGSTFAIEGIFSKDGKIFGKMGHCERINENLYKNITGNLDENIFKSGIKYFK